MLLLLQRGFDLDANEILGIVQPPPPLLVRCAEPVTPDHHEHDVAKCDLRLYVFYEVKTRRNAIYVKEQAIRTEIFAQPFIETNSECLLILSAIADKNIPRHASWPLSAQGA